MPNDKNRFDKNNEESAALTSSELKYIIDVNTKAIEINFEVDKQNQKILEKFELFEEAKEEIEELRIVSSNIERLISEDNADYHEDIKIFLKDFEKSFIEIKNHNDKFKSIVEKLKETTEEIDKNIFRLIVILTSTGVVAIINLVTTLMKK